MGCVASEVASPETVGAIQAMDEEFICSINSGNVEELASAFYAADAELLPPNAPVMSGHAAIRECWKRMMCAGLNISLQAKRIEESGGLVYASGVHDPTLTPLRGCHDFRPGQVRGCLSAAGGRQLEGGLPCETERQLHLARVVG
jgi:ketosteroid isomerase-like protein